MRPLQAIVFDFDGVLADTEPLHFRAIQSELEASGLSLSREDYYSRYLGFTDHEVFAQVSDERGAGWSDEVVHARVSSKAVRFLRLVESGSPLFAGVTDLVRDWATALPLAIASGALRSDIDAILGPSGLASAFTAIVTADDVPDGKPRPGPYLAAVRRLAEASGLAVEPCRCVAIEDSPLGITAARAAGLRVVGVRSSYGADVLAAADLVVGSVTELSLDHLEALVLRAGG